MLIKWQTSKVNHALPEGNSLPFWDSTKLWPFIFSFIWNLKSLKEAIVIRFPFSHMDYQMLTMHNYDAFFFVSVLPGTHCPELIIKVESISRNFRFASLSLVA